MYRFFLVCSFFLFGVLFSEDTIYIPDGDQGLVVANEQIIEDPMQDLFGDGYASSFKRMMLSMVSLIALVGASLWFFKRMIRNRHRGSIDTTQIKILEKKILSPKTMLYLVEIDQEKVLLSESHLEVRPLHTSEKKHSTPAAASQHVMSQFLENNKQS